jgi:hypothetical protein
MAMCDRAWDTVKRRCRMLPAPSGDIGAPRIIAGRDGYVTGTLGNEVSTWGNDDHRAGTKGSSRGKRRPHGRRHRGTRPDDDSIERFAGGAGARASIDVELVSRATRGVSHRTQTSGTRSYLVRGVPEGG